MPFPSKMYFAMLALLMLAVAHAAPLDPVLPRDILANTRPSNIERRPATKRHNIPPFSEASSPLGTKTTRSMPMAMQAREHETILHSRTEEIRRSTIDRDESRRGWASSSPSVRGYNEQRSLAGEEKKSSSRAGAHYPRAQDHSSDKSTYQHISSISSRQLRAPDYDSAGNQSNSTTEENGSHPTTHEEQKGSSSTKDKESKEKRTVPVEWSKTRSEERDASGDKIAQRD